MSLPSIFISHGAPDLVLQKSEAANFLRNLPNILDTPKAIVIVSAHFEASGAKVVSDPNPETIYDFGGFDPSLYQMTYPAKGDPQLANRVFDHLKSAGIDSELVSNRGFDHGVWSPLSLVYPQADIPIVQVSIDPSRDAKYHYELGKALAPLRHEDILLIGSGHITHNLRAVFSVMQTGRVDAVMGEKVDAFTEWFHEQFEAGNKDAILDWRNSAPFPVENHPTDEHLMPIFFSYGASSNDEEATAQRIHSSKQFDSFVYDVYKFG